MTTQQKIPASPPATSPPEAPTVAAAGRERRKFTVAEYYRMADVGILGPDERVELIEGDIIVMAPIGPGHAGSVDIIGNLFVRKLGEGFIVRSQNPIHLDDGSEPQPDIVVAFHRDDYYTSAHPTPVDILLTVEVAQSSLEYDRDIKAHLYGRNAIPETWVRNLPEDCIERFTEPGPDGYLQHTIHRRGESITPGSLPDLVLAVEDLLPPPAAAEDE
ncbi:MAG: Uma2 family endonuclease [Chloroflexi bacterium]|nr:Uma2 family endonuclease [Chloroflexota bacterium]